FIVHLDLDLGCPSSTFLHRDASPSFTYTFPNNGTMNSVTNAVMTKMPARFSQKPAFIICGSRISPVPNTIAFGGVPTVSTPRDEATSLRRFALHKPSLRNMPGLLAKTYKGLLLYFGAIEGSWRGKRVE